jgi:hypothetical protein
MVIGQSQRADSVQLSGKGLLPFNADKQTAIGLAFFYAFGNHTDLYTLNTTDLAVPPTAVRGRYLPTC